MHRLVCMMIMLALLSGCSFGGSKRPVSTDEPTVTISTIETKATTAKNTETEITSVTEEPSQTLSSEELTFVSELVSEESVSSLTTTEESETSYADEVTEQKSENAPQESEVESEDENPPLEVYGKTSEGEEFAINPDYAFFIVNKQIPLPDDYSIEKDYVQGEYVLEKTAAYYCRQMIDAAKEDGIELKVLSAYRSVSYQKRLFERNVESRMEDGMSYEEAVADVSVNIAPPGGSEHNAGLAVDIITADDWDTYEGFEDTEEFRWLQENAADFGFIMRYHKGKEHITGYIYEPWHYRYLGIKYAKDVQESGLCLEEYFAKYVNSEG